jgi:hypothetical protein
MSEKKSKLDVLWENVMSTSIKMYLEKSNNTVQENQINNNAKFSNEQKEDLLKEQKRRYERNINKLAKEWSNLRNDIEKEIFINRG